MSLKPIPLLMSRSQHVERLNRIAGPLGYVFEPLDSLEALAASLAKSPASAVWTDCCVDDGDWRDVLALCQRQQPPLPVVVAAPSDSPALWAEVAEAGVAEFLSAPFAAPEVRRCLLTIGGETLQAEPLEAAV